MSAILQILESINTLIRISGNLFLLIADSDSESVYQKYKFDIKRKSIILYDCSLFISIYSYNTTNGVFYCMYMCVILNFKSVKCH